jgi:iron complex outermembrane receptor protein
VDSTYYGKPGARADYSGNEIVGVPSVIANAEIGSAIPGMPSLRIKGGVEHTGRYYLDDANTTRVKPFTTMSATLEFGEWTAGRALGLGLRGFVSVENIFDTHYVGSAFLNPDRVGGIPVAYEPGMPRSVVVSLSAGRLR